MPDVAGSCPACGAASLFLGEGGHVTCARIECPNPCAADELLHGGEAALVQALGGDRTARVIAHTLTAHGRSLTDVHRMADEEFRAVPGIGDTSLATIRQAFPQQSPSRAGDVLAALGRRIPETLAKGINRDEYALAPASEPPVIGAARIQLDVAPTLSAHASRCPRGQTTRLLSVDSAGAHWHEDSSSPSEPSAARELAALQRHAARVTQKTDATVTVAPYGDKYQVAITRAGGTTRHGGYDFDAVQGMLLGVMAAADYRQERTPSTEERPDA